MSKLSEYIADRRLVQLPEGSPAEKIEAIIDRPDALQFIQAIDGPVLYDLIKQAGWDDAQELMAYVSPEQFQTFVDLDCWRKDKFVPGALHPWLAGIITEADDKTFKKHCRESDPEILAMYFKENVLVDLMDEEGQVPPQFEDLYVETSPDGVYAIVYPEDEQASALMRALLNRLYEVDRVLAWTLLEAVRWELVSPMEDEAYRWRTSRLQEYGFVDFDEAMAIYRPLDPAKYRDRIEAGTIEAKAGVVAPENLPMIPDLVSEDRFYAAQILQRLDGTELDRAMAEFVALQNRAFVADGIEPADASEGTFVAERTTGYLSIGLEFLSRRDDDAALRIMRTVPLRDVFRAGFTIVERLRTNVAKLRHRPTMTLIEGERFSFLRGSDAALCEALLNARPMYASDAFEHDIFRTQSQVDDAAMRIGLIAFKQLWLFGVLAVEPPELVRLAYGKVWRNEPPSVTFDAVFGTWVARYALGGRPDMYGLSVEELERLPAIVAVRPWADDPLLWFSDLVGQVLDVMPTAARLMTRWLEATLQRFEEELGAVTSIERPELFVDLFLIQRGGADA